MTDCTGTGFPNISPDALEALMTAVDDMNKSKKEDSRDLAVTPT